MKKMIIAVALVLGVSACTGADISVVGDPPDRQMTIANVPGRDEVVRGDTDPAVVTLDLKTAFRSRRLRPMQQLPAHIMVPATNLDGVPITAALQAVLSGTDISLSWSAGALGSRLVTVMNLKGPLPSVVERICSAARVFCAYRHGSIELSESETFMINLPPVARSIGSSSISSSSSSAPISSGSVANTIVDAINSLLDGAKATVDDHGGTIVYSADVEAHERVSRYLEEIRTERPLIVLQMFIWEVILNKENSQGISWTRFKNHSINDVELSLTNKLASAATSGSVSLGAITSGVISTDAVVSFLSTKGRVQTISNPQVTFVSGSAAALKVGGTKKYISQVGTTTSNTSGTSTSSNTNSITTDEIETGLAINVAGSYENGVVFANLDLSLRSLLGLYPTLSGGLTIDLPETTDQRINTVLRVRPGDSLLLAGLVSSSSNAKSEGFPTGGDTALPLYGNDQRQNRELVMIVRPSVVLFADKKETEPASMEKPKLSGAFPEPVVIDKDGARPFGFSSQSPRRPQRVPLNKTSAPAEDVLVDSNDDWGQEHQSSFEVKPQPLMEPRQQASLPVAEPRVERTPLSSSDENSYDSIRKGFANAFDKLFQSSSAEEEEIVQ